MKFTSRLLLYILHVFLQKNEKLVLDRLLLFNSIEI